METWGRQHTALPMCCRKKKGGWEGGGELFPAVKLNPFQLKNRRKTNSCGSCYKRVWQLPTFCPTSQSSPFVWCSGKSPLEHKRRSVDCSPAAGEGGSAPCWGSAAGERNALRQVAKPRINCSLCGATTQPGFPGPFFPAGNFVQTVIKVPKVSEQFCRPCQARSLTREITQIAARAPICACISSWWSSKL